MPFIDATFYASRRSATELEMLVAAGAASLVEPVTWQGQRRRFAESFIEDFERLLGREADRAAALGLGYGVCMGVPAGDALDPGMVEVVLDHLPRFLAQPRVVAIGEIGLGKGGPGQETAFQRQVQLARRFGLPIVVAAEPGATVDHVTRLLALVSDVGLPPRTMLVNGLSREAMPLVRRYGAWIGLLLDPRTHLGPADVLGLLVREGVDGYLVGSGAGGRSGDPLAVVRLARQMAEARLLPAVVDRLLYHNPKWFYSQGRALPLGAQAGPEGPLAQAGFALAASGRGGPG